jgi:hypothetical protein
LLSGGKIEDQLTEKNNVAGTLLNKSKNNIYLSDNKYYCSSAIKLE